ncbi:hypothetical protein [Nonomuraea salmonea]|uniref:Uncharacterized protein n=1 Tax=Nonomuraea salmonea TaxID=46181 RepID=A0ABV5NGF7_9ACTN
MDALLAGRAEVPAGEQGRNAKAALAPAGRPYGSSLSFSHPDGDGWVPQEVTTRLPGRV